MLYVMRHGKTDWNAEFKLQGNIDIPLNEEGRQMARNAAEEYKDIHFDICYVSPLVRALETAQILLENRDIPIITENRLKEMSFGIYEGFKGVFEHPELPIYKLFKDPENYIPPEGAETFESLFNRTGEFLKEVVQKDLDAGKDVLIVGHGALNSCIITQLKKLELKDFWSNGIPNCKLFKLI